MNRETAPGTGFAQTARFKPSRTDPLNRETAPRPAAIPGQIARFENLRIYPMIPDTPPAAPSTQTARVKNLRIYPMIPEPAPRRPGPGAAPAERSAKTPMQRGAGAAARKMKIGNDTATLAPQSCPLMRPVNPGR